MITGTTMESFNAVWTDLRNRLHTGTTIRNWSALKGCTGRDFRVVSVDPRAITVAGGRMRAGRPVSRGDFERVYSVWDAYRDGRYPRGEMLSLSQNTTYILSLLYWREVTLK
jgi:hypothetical protein